MRTREELTTQLRKLVGEYDALTARAGKILSIIYDHTYAWVNLWCDVHDGRSIDEGIKSLAATLKRGNKGVQSWYYCGKYMADNKLSDMVDHRSVRAVYSSRGSLAKSDQLQCVQLIRDRAPHDQVMRILNRSASRLAAQADRKAAVLDKRGQLTKTRIRMEMLALRTMAMRFYKLDDLDVAVLDKRGKVIESTGGKSAGAKAG